MPQHSGGDKVSYLGETLASFFQRTKDHMVQTLGGNYEVLEADDAQQGVKTIIWKSLWRKPTRHQTVEFMKRYAELAPRIAASLRVHRLFVAPLTCERHVQRQIEFALVAQFNTDPGAAVLMSPDVRYYRPKLKSDGLCCTVTLPNGVAIDGIPSAFDA